jgi:hypothetical protein
MRAVRGVQCVWKLTLTLPLPSLLPVPVLSLLFLPAGSSPGGRRGSGPEGAAGSRDRPPGGGAAPAPAPAAANAWRCPLLLCALGLPSNCRSGLSADYACTHAHSCFFTTCTPTHTGLAHSANADCRARLPRGSGQGRGAPLSPGWVPWPCCTALYCTVLQRACPAVPSLLLRR